MPDTIWIDNIRKIALQAVEAGEPCDVISGKVLSQNPLEIQISQKIILSSKQIILPQQFTDHTEDMLIPGVGEVSVLVKNGLKTGDKVLLLQKRGGQQFVVMGKW